MNAPRRDHALYDIVPPTTRVGDSLQASTAIAPAMWVPGTTSLRTSMLALWTDITAGLLVVELIHPRVPVTLELDVHVYEPLPASGVVHIVVHPVKTGRSVNVLTVDFADDGGEPLATGAASFMAAPDPKLTMPADRLRQVRELPAERRTNGVPLAERMQCERRGPGVAVLPRSDSTINSSNTVNGGLIALAVEEAALSLSPGTLVASLALRYLRPVRLGPAVATAHVRGGLGRIEVRDAGAGDRLAVVATTRTFPASTTSGDEPETFDPVSGIQ